LDKIETKSLGHRIKLCRLSKGFTQLDLAHLLGMKRENVSGYENGRIIPPSTVIIALSKIFNVSSDFLLGLEFDNLLRTEWDKDTVAIILVRINMDKCEKNRMMHLLKHEFKEEFRIIKNIL
jgi:transcriptional regulator with XRE-family HTH domain